MTVEKITLEEFKARAKAQGVPRVNVAVICPMCGTIQSMADLIAAGAGKTEADVERYIGFSCVGRWTGAPGPRKNPDGKPCDWTLGGLFSVHKLAVVIDGKEHPHFEIATPEHAKAHMQGVPA